MITEQSDPHSHMDSAEHAKHLRQRRAMLITGLIVAGIVLAPHILPAMGIGELAVDTALNSCTGLSATGTGIAGFASNALSHVPLIGAQLMTGGWANSVVSGVVGVGGTLLGNYLEKKEDGKTGIKWGSVIRTLAITTSIFVALPALFPAISMGVTYLAAMILPNAVPIGNFLASTLGSLGAAAPTETALGAGSLMLPHLLSCGTMLGVGATNVKRAQDAQLPPEERPKGFVARLNENIDHSVEQAFSR